MGKQTKIDIIATFNFFMLNTLNTCEAKHTKENQTCSRPHLEINTSLLDLIFVVLDFIYMKYIYIFKIALSSYQRNVAQYVFTFLTLLVSVL